VLRRWFPFAELLSMPAFPTARPPRRRLQFCVRLVPPALVLGLLAWQAFASPPSRTVVPAPAAPAIPSRPTEHDAVLAVIAQFNAAESVAAATLDPAPLAPYLAPDGPFAARRAATLARRAARQAPHTTQLLSWIVGAITVDDNQAIVATREVWTNREAGAVVPTEVAVRVTYTLRRNATTGRWQILDTQHLPI
jgi:hypothetical protein